MLNAITIHNEHYGCQHHRDWALYNFRTRKSLFCYYSSPSNVIHTRAQSSCCAKIFLFVSLQLIRLYAICLIWSLFVVSFVCSFSCATRTSSVHRKTVCILHTDTKNHFASLTGRFPIEATRSVTLHGNCSLRLFAARKHIECAIQKLCRQQHENSVLKLRR